MTTYRTPKIPQMLNSSVSETRMVGSAAAHLARMDGSRLPVNSFQKAAHFSLLTASGGAQCARPFR